MKERDDEPIDVFYNKRLRKIPRIKRQDDVSFFYLNIFTIAPRLIKGAHNNTLIRLTHKSDRHKQHTKLQQLN